MTLYTVDNIHATNSIFWTVDDGLKSIHTEYIYIQMLISCLAYSNILLNAVTKAWRCLKYTLVQYLGNNPTNYYLLKDGRVLPDTISLPDHEIQTAFLYDSESHTIRKASDANPQGRFRPLPYLSITFQNTYIETIDISDWLGEVRANPVPNTMSVQQILSLWSIVNRRYVPTGDNLEIHVVDSDANETVIHSDSFTSSGRHAVGTEHPPPSCPLQTCVPRPAC